MKYWNEYRCSHPFTSFVSLVFIRSIVLVQIPRHFPIYVTSIVIYSRSSHPSAQRSTNHETDSSLGSFGTYPRQVRDVLHQLQSAAEARPDPFQRYTYPMLLDASRSAIAALLNVPDSECVFVPNATTGVNTVLRNLVYAPGDVIVYFATIYGACEKTVQYVVETTPVESCCIAFQYPVSDSWLIDTLRSTIQEVRKRGRNPCLAMFDTVVSMPGVRMPFEELAGVCKDQGVLSLIDGAHGVGMLGSGLDLGRLGADFFVTNCHK
jgi:hercynylcysteine S-oxide lyase